VIRRALEACASLRGKNVFLDLALDAGDRVHLPEESKLVGYPKQERAFLVFLKTIEPHLPTSPSSGHRSLGSLVLQSEAGAMWHVSFSYGLRPKITVQRVAWVPVPLGAIRALPTPKSAKKSPSIPGTRFVEALGDFAVLRVAANRLVVVRGSAGTQGKTSTKTFAHQWQATAAFERLATSLQKKGFRRARG
jgi:hypothetical protein